MRFRNFRWGRRGERIIGGAAATLAASLASLAGAAEAPASTVTFEYTGGSQTWTVPGGVTSATFDLYGAAGGRNIIGGGFAGGGRATATIPVSPGASYQVNVGQLGLGGGASAFGGGGPGGYYVSGPNTLYGAGGGGASDVRFGGTGLTDRILVAGGGGGGGFCYDGGSGYTRGGPGGGLTGGDGFDPCADSGVAGGGGTQSAGGTAGGDATPGSFGAGGAGGFNTGTGAPGGGGGGWYGGGGGSEAIAGGGGSGYGPPGTVFETGVRQGDGLVTVTYADPVDDPPRILRLAVSPNRFVAGSGDTPLSRRAGSGVEIDLSEQASVRFRVRRDPRLRTGTPPPHRARAFERDLPAGESVVGFSGRLDGRAFKPGRYEIVARATDAAGQRSDKAVAAFRIRAG